MENILQTVVTIGSVTAIMWGMLKFLLRDIHSQLNIIKQDVVEIKTDSKRSEARIDHLHEENNRLYRTLIEIVQKKQS